MKDKIIDILIEELCEVNCDSCDAEYCEDCNRKEQNWGIGYHKAEKIADRILNKRIIQKYCEGVNFKMDRIDYTNKILDTIDNALNDLSSEDFDILIQRVQEYIDDLN